MGDQFLEQLLESPIKAKLLRLFLNNPDRWFGTYEATRRTQGRKTSVRSHCEKLYDLKLLRRRTKRLTKEERGSRRGRTPKKEKQYKANTSFPFYEDLRRFVLHSRPVTSETMRRRIKKTGNIKLAVLSGAFVHNEGARADMLLVGSDLRERRIDNLIKKLEAENGRELRCVVMTTDQFEYRHSLFDRFVHDLVEGKNEVLIDRMGVTEV